MKKELVSIIIPVYNTEKYLEVCLDSVCSQTYKNLEIILINDGSTDNSEEICQKFKDMDQRIQIYTCFNSGPAFARNLGLSKAHGEYIMFVDSDDWILPELVDTLYDWIQIYKGDVSITYVLKEQEQKYYEELGKGLVEKNKFMKYFLSDSIKSYLMGKLYKKKLWNDIRFPNGQKVEDLAVLYKVFEKANRIINVNQNLYHYNQDNPNSETKGCRNIEGLYPRCIFNFERYDFSKENYPFVTDEVLYQAVSYGNICVLKMWNKTCYNEQKQNILNYFIKNKKNIMKSKTIPIYKKIEANCIMNKWDFCCNLLRKIHEKKENK